MLILPAIDIKDGNCVRLYKGAFDSVEKVADSALDTAFTFRQCGASWVHMVDLDGALGGGTPNCEIFLQVANKSGLKVELGGGIRDMDVVESYLSGGISRVILGSAALKKPELVRDAVREYGEHIAVGIDARDGFVAAEGWLETSKVHYIDFAKEMERVGVRTIIFTDISKDGTLLGPNMEQLKTLGENVRCNIIASGGVRDIENIRALKKGGFYGAICGKSIYSGTLDLKEAIGEAGEQSNAC